MSNTSLPGVVQSAPSTSLVIEADIVITVGGSTVVFLDSAQRTICHSSIVGHLKAWSPSAASGLLQPTRWRSPMSVNL
ncbi:hypothetical protein [Undibacterium umbellatum]|uniref:Uncharacterized protein n=1 Tax=Undibacterium umbellatum TaxID=2762300 RepID=A0ABR6Z425_9BURK|nr:hypothetical protein [Undibacterium umbellatum]MBC3906546.1 hypothetical protein [Undibacterium umbellatum]